MPITIEHIYKSVHGNNVWLNIRYKPRSLRW